MASVYKHSRGRTPFWIAVYRDFDGRQRHRSTKKTVHHEAMAVCEKWQRQADKLRGENGLQNKEHLMESFITATQKAASGQFTEAIARKMLNEILEAGGQAPMNLVSIEDYFSSWVSSKEISKAQGTSKRYRHTINEFLKFIGQRAKLNLASLTPRDIEGFRDSQLKDGKTATTANMVVKTLRIPLNLARRQGLILTNPAEAVDLLEADSAQRSIFSVEQIQNLLKHADREWQGMILMGMCCGLRIGAAARLTWASVDFERKVICHFPQKRSKRAKNIPVESVMLPDLENYLLSAPVRGRSVDISLFPVLAKAKPSGCNGLSARFQKLMHSAGIYAKPDDRKIKGKGRHFNDLTFHSLRHTCISTMANIGVSREIRMKLAGHTSDVHDRYTRIELETMRQALEKFPHLLTPLCASASQQHGVPSKAILTAVKSVATGLQRGS